MGIRRLCWGVLYIGAGALAMSTPTNTLISDLPLQETAFSVA